MPRRIRNFDRTLSWKPTVVHRPRDAEEVAKAVSDAVDRGGRIKAVGSSLSWSDIADIPEAVIQLDEMASISVDRDAKLATVQCGAKLSSVNNALAAEGLAFENFGSIVSQTAGGYTGTGTHGTGGSIPILSSYIESMRLVDGTGTIHELSREKEPELFSKARVHLGALGVVTDITFRCVEAFSLEEQLEFWPYDQVLAELDELVANNDYLKLWWLPYQKKIQVYRFNRTTEPNTRRGVQEFFDSSGLSGFVFSHLIGMTRLVPRSIPRFLGVIQGLGFRPHRRIDRSDKIIRYAGSIPRHQETEYAIPREHASEALGRVRDLVMNQNGYWVNFPQEVRFVAGDDIPMSSCYQRDSCYLGGYIASKKWAPQYYADFEKLMAEYQGRPHWGKTFNRTAAELQALYPEYDAFNALRKKCDPHEVFRNAFIDRVFPE